MAKTLRLKLGKIGTSPATVQQSVAQAGMVGRATADLGGSIVRAGQQIGSLFERRRAEEDRDTISNERATNKLNSAAEFEELREQFANNPIGFADALDKQQMKRQGKVLKGISSTTAKEQLDKQFQLSRLENRLAAVSFERTQFTKNSIANLTNNATIKAQTDYEKPTDIKDFLLDLDFDVEIDIGDRDLDDITKDSLKKSVTETRVNGAISGYLRGGNIRDFIRAQELVKQLGPRISPDYTDKLNRKIDSERIRQQNFKAFSERLDREALRKRFTIEQGELRDIFEEIIKNPDADVTDDLKKSKSLGRISGENFTVVSRKKMSSEQQDRSESLRMTTLNMLADSENVEAVRETLYQNVISGQLNAEDAVAVLDSIQVRTDKTFKRSEYKFADGILRNSATSGFSFNKRVQRELLTDMFHQRDRIVREFGVDPATASKIILKERGKTSFAGIGKVRSLKSDQNTIKGIGEARNELAGKIRNKKISREEAIKALDILDKREEALQEVPSLKELQEGKK